MVLWVQRYVVIMCVQGYVVVLTMVCTRVCGEGTGIYNYNANLSMRLKVV